MIREVVAVTATDGVKALRARARAARDAIAPAVRAAAAAAAAAAVDRALADLPAGAVVALYAPIRSELPTGDVAAAAAARGLVLAYPRVVPGDRVLAFHRVPAEALAAGHLGIPEPDPAAPAVDPADLAAIVVPGLVFDRRGYRLGWGGGHYDATLPRAAHALRVGLAFEQQLVERLPIQPHDCPVHLIATEVALHPGAPRDARRGIS